MSRITVLNQTIDPVVWDDPIQCNFEVGNNVHIWRINVNDSLSRPGKIPNLLNHAELTRVNRYLRDADRSRFFISRTALRVILGKYLNAGPAGIEFQTGENGKPFIAGHDIHFNLSDSADWIIIAIAGSEVGVDVEYIKPGFDYSGIIRHNFNEPEIKYIEAENYLNRFFKLWTRKEAILKASGTGLTEHLQSINALDGLQTMQGELLNTQINWKLSTFDLAESYPATFATNTSTKKCYFYNFEF